MDSYKGILVDVIKYAPLTVKQTNYSHFPASKPDSRHVLITSKPGSIKSKQWMDSAELLPYFIWPNRPVLA